jgi:hypothetical protein
MARVTNTELPSWAIESLNGGSMRVPRAQHSHDLAPGDVLAGMVMQLGKVTIDVAVESGIFQGQEIEVGEWRRVHIDCGILRRWIARDNPQVGEKVVLSFLGRTGDNGRGGHGEFDYACGTFREAPVATWE